MIYYYYYIKRNQEKQEPKGGFRVQTLTYTVEKEENGQTVKTVLQRRGVSTGTLRRLKQTDGILVNQQAVTVRHKVTQGQTITLQLPETPSEFVKPVPLDLEIAYEDDGVLVVNIMKLLSNTGIAYQK